MITFVLSIHGPGYRISFKLNMSALAASAKGFGAAELNRHKTELIPIVKSLVNWYQSLESVMKLEG